MNIKNLTPHKLNIYNEEGELVIEVEPEEQSARCAVKRMFDFTEDGVPFYRTTYGEVENLPQRSFTDETVYVVSGMVRSAVSRGDLYQPGELLRDDKGRVIGCVGLSQ